LRFRQRAGDAAARLAPRTAGARSERCPRRFLRGTAASPTNEAQRVGDRPARQGAAPRPPVPWGRFVL